MLIKQDLLLWYVHHNIILVQTKKTKDPQVSGKDLKFHTSSILDQSLLAPYFTY